MVSWGDGLTRSVWSQFADDATIAGEDYHKTQLILSFFQRWTSWADLTIRPDKSHAYTATQINGRYQQIEPKFFCNGLPILAIKSGEAMTFLGRDFSFASDGEMAKQILLQGTQDCIDLASSLPITPSLKCHALNLWLRAKLSFPLSHYSVSITWIKLHLDSLISGKVRSWMDLPPSATAHFISLPEKMLGLDLILPSLLAELCQAGTAMTLAHSSDPNMRKLQMLQKGAPTPGSFLTLARKEASKSIKKQQLHSQLDMLENLKVQSLILKSLRAALPSWEL